ncbi:MAG TPA: hypothetical protein VHI77_01200 [Solirubrobacterales bacterium]|nr:hypothetical protein [Solirubrobacterales bacterium]
MVVALLALLAPSAATAHPKALRLTDLTAWMRLPGSHGYRIEIEAFTDTVYLTVHARDGAEAEYSVKGNVSPHMVKANFGSFGLISVSFDGGRVKHRFKRTRCGPQSEMFQRGTFKGTIRFQGEEGFTSVSAHSARGSVEQSVETVCLSPERQRRERGDAHAGRRRPRGAMSPSAAASVASRTTVLGASEAEADRGVGFFYEASADERHGEVSDHGDAVLNAQVVERRGRIEIERRQIFEGPAGSLIVRPPSDGSQAALLTLASPFAGSAEYSKRQGADAASWIGDLRVALPGEPEVSLAGPGFRALFCRGNEEAKKVDSCVDDAVSLFFEGLLLEE